MGAERRLGELAKDVVIVLLALCALYLLTRTPLVQDSGLLASTPPPAGAGAGDTVTLTAAAYPSRMAIQTPQGRYGVQYEQQAVDSLFARVGPLLGEALSFAQQPQPVEEAQWQQSLADTGIYFDFAGQVPLSALGSWLQPGSTCALEGSARRILLFQGEDGRVQLAYQEGSGGFYVCATDLSGPLHIQPALEGVEENGAQFAFEHPLLSQLLDPYTLLTEETGGAVYAASNPLGAEGGLSGLLEALSFNGQNHTTVSGGQAFLEGESRLEVQDNGTVTYRAAGPGKYPVVHSGSQPTLAEMIETVRKLAEATVGARCGQARLYLSSAQETERGWEICFGYQLNGSGVWLYQEGWAAQFYLQDGAVAEFTLHLRSYEATGEQALLLPVERAALLVPALTNRRRELLVQYRDQGESTVSPIWVAQ